MGGFLFQTDVEPFTFSSLASSSLTAFESKILPKHFYKHSKYPSFTRKLNRWGFVRVTRGPETGAYFHPCFRRGDYRLVMQMSCSNITTKNKTEYWLNKRAPPIGGYSMLPLLSQSAARDELNARESSLYPNLSLQAARTAEAMFTATKQQHQQEEPLLQYHFVQQQRLLQQELMLRQLATSNSRSQYQHLFPSPEPRLGGLSLALNTTLTSQRLLYNTSNMTIDQHPALLLQQFRNNQGPTVPNSIRSLLAQLKQQRLPNASPNFFE